MKHEINPNTNNQLKPVLTLNLALELVEMTDLDDPSEVLGHEWEAEITPVLIESAYEGFTPKLSFRPVGMSTCRRGSAEDALEQASFRLPLLPMSWDDEEIWLEAIHELMKDVYAVPGNTPLGTRHSILMPVTSEETTALAVELAPDQSCSMVVDLPKWMTTPRLNRSGIFGRISSTLTAKVELILLKFVVVILASLGAWLR